MKSVVALLASLCLCYCLATNAHAGESLSPEQIENAAAQAIRSKAMLEFSKGNFEDASTFLLMASVMSKDPYSNAVSVLYAGVSECLTGDADASKKTFSDFTCMANIALGKLHCPGGRPNGSSDVSSQYTKSCVFRMCTSIKDRRPPNSSQVKEVRAALKVLSHFDTSCGG